MGIRTTIVGSYPKVIETGSDNLPGTIDRWQRKLLSDDQLEQEIQKVIRRVLQEQEQAGLDLVTDGQIRWEDLPHSIARSCKGVARGALRRVFDNNTYYRRLEHTGAASWQKSAVSDEAAFASKHAKAPVKASLPGPLTLVISTEMAPGQSAPQLLALYAGILRQEVEALAKAGVQNIQIEEPALRPGEPLLEKAIEAINGIFRGIHAKRWVALYFHDVAPILPQLAKLEADVLSLDLVTAPNLADQLAGWQWKGELALGVVDARNTKLEKPAEAAAQVKKVAKSFPADRLWVTPNCGLEFLPHEAAVKKLQLLRQIANN